MSEMRGGILGGGALDIAGSVLETRGKHRAALENVDFYRQGAVDEAVAALDREQVRRTQLREVLGQQVVDVAKSGVGFTGSAILALNESVLRGEQEMLALKRQGESRVSDFLRAASGELDTARQARRAQPLRIARSAVRTAYNLERSRQPVDRSATDRIDE